MSAYSIAPFVLGPQSLPYVMVTVRPRRVLIGDIQRIVTRYYGLSPLDLVSARRSRDVARPRQIAMYLARHHTKASLPEIGKRFGRRDHTTVIHAIRTISRLRCEDDQIATDVLTLEKDLAA